MIGYHKLIIGVVFCSLSFATIFGAEDELSFGETQARQKADSARLFFRKSDYKNAERSVKESNLLCDTTDIELLIGNYSLLITIDSINKDFRSALSHLSQKEELTNKVLTAKRDQARNEIAHNHHIQQKEEEIASIRKKVAENDIKYERNKKIVVFLSILTLILFIFTLLRTYQSRKRVKSNRKLLDEINANKHHLELLTKQFNEQSSYIQKIAQENTGLENANAVKNRLLSIISHDLRSPMSSLQALLNLFNTNGIARKDLIDFFGKLLSRVENTSTMLENLLHWSHYQLNGIEPIFEKVDIQKIIDDSINFYHMQAEQKRIVIDNSLRTSVLVYADIEMLKIILRNLISNALKFTYNGGIITIKAFKKEGYVIVSVKDTGIGITSEDQSKIFSMSNFTTLGTDKEKGTGLGLMLCKDFVEHNRGKIWLDSKIGVGTTFYFSIPLAEED
ncbi:MAG: HAMP domain-containing histidine kinase [Bacteroidales bacterium]|jgi:signal transduction histidine kinase|nr:HAMP domain-containing histidine kinase [Bacteroidales bacterium]